MRKSVCFAVLMTLLGTNNLFAAQRSDGAVFRDYWGVNDGWKDSWQCNNCISSTGISVRGDSYTHFNWDLGSYGNYGTVYYVAHEMNEGGAKFCKTIIGADRGNCHGSPYTTYYKSGDDCFWLCKSGYHGAGCAKINNGAADTCQSIERFTAHTPKAHLSSYTPGTDIDSTIPMFYYGVYRSCGSNNMTCFNSDKGQEHDVILAIKSVTKDETNATLTFVSSPLVVRAAGTRTCLYGGQHHAWPLLSWVGTQKNLCPEGWIQGTDGKCKIDADSEACHLANLCGGFPKEKYNPKEYYTKKSDKDTCYEYRCNEGTAFKAKDDLTCTPCAPTDAEIPELYYVPKDGLCHSCNKGQWPVAQTQTVEGKTVPSGEYDCNDAKPFTHNELQYGQKTVPDTVTVDQCWTKTNPDDFFGCVTGKCSDGKVWGCDGACEADFKTCPTKTK